MKEAKKVTTLNLREDVTTYARQNKINLSEWVNSKFHSEFLSGPAILARIQQHKDEIVKEEAKLASIKNRRDEVAKSLTNREIRYITSVKARQTKGFKLEAMHQYFNEEFHRNISPDEFKELVNFYEKAADERVERVANKVKKHVK